MCLLHDGALYCCSDLYQMTQAWANSMPLRTPNFENHHCSHHDLSTVSILGPLGLPATHPSVPALSMRDPLGLPSHILPCLSCQCATHWASHHKAYHEFCICARLETSSSESSHWFQLPYTDSLYFSVSLIGREKPDFPKHSSSPEYHTYASHRTVNS